MLLAISFVVTTLMVLLAFIIARRILIDVIGYHGRQMLLASSAMATLTIALLVVALKVATGSEWSTVPLATTVLSGLFVGVWMTRREP